MGGKSVPRRRRAPTAGDRQRVRHRGPLPVTLTLEIGVQVARALQATEAGGIIHRDLKPSNPMLAVDPDSPDTHEPVVKVIDFGLARAVSAAGGDGSTTNTTSGATTNGHDRSLPPPCKPPPATPRPG